MLRCYTLPTLNLADDLCKSFHTVIFIFNVMLLHIAYLKPIVDL